jgi:cytochrome o ubiquinol oxidase subunit 3
MSDSLTIYHTPDPHPDTRVPDPHQDTFSKTTLGFWLYLMTDCLVFATLFTTYAVLHRETFGGPTSAQLFDLKLSFAETMILLLSTVTCGMSVLATYRKKNHVIGWLAATFILGAAFLALEISEFVHFVHEGHSWDKSAFLSAYFTLVGTHGLHIAVGLTWISVMIGQVLYFGINVITFRRLTLFSLFWHFLDVVWIFIFTFVYLLGVL